MANYRDIFKIKSSRNWIKFWVAVYTVTAGLVNFVNFKDEIEYFHGDILSKLPPDHTICPKCLTPNAVPCASKHICIVRQGKGNFHKGVAKTYKSCPIHDIFQNEIHQRHRFSTPSWKDTKADLWATSPTEISKCYMPPGGYVDKASVEDTDFNGLAAVILNCKRFQNQLVVDLSQIVNICSETRTTVNAVRHFEYMSWAIDDILIDLLHKLGDLFDDDDTKYFRKYPDALHAGSVFEKLKTDLSLIDDDYTHKCFKEAMRELDKWRKSNKSNDESQAKCVQDVKGDIDIYLTKAIEEIEKVKAECVVGVKASLTQGYETFKKVQTPTPVECCTSRRGKASPAKALTPKKISPVKRGKSTRGKPASPVKAPTPAKKGRSNRAAPKIASTVKVVKETVKKASPVNPSIPAKGRTSRRGKAATPRKANPAKTATHRKASPAKRGKATRVKPTSPVKVPTPAKNGRSTRAAPTVATPVKPVEEPIQADYIFNLKIIQLHLGKLSSEESALTLKKDHCKAKTPVKGKATRKGTKASSPVKAASPVKGRGRRAAPKMKTPVVEPPAVNKKRKAKLQKTKAAKKVRPVKVASPVQKATRGGSMTQIKPVTQAVTPAKRATRGGKVSAIPATPKAKVVLKKSSHVKKATGKTLSPVTKAAVKEHSPIKKAAVKQSPVKKAPTPAKRMTRARR